MSSLRAAYCELITSPAQLTWLRQARSVAELLAQLKQLWQQEMLSDDQLLAELTRCNQQVWDLAIDRVDGQWVPYRYNAKNRSICWCLHDGHATEAFQDETISRYRQRILLNQFIIPQISRASLVAQIHSASLIPPAGFIFHLSRCGSTLVSGCLSELDSTSVLSESPVLTAIVLDSSIAASEKQQLLLKLIDVYARRFVDRSRVVIKWNAWDVFQWALLRGLYPQVPAVVLVRNPVEILASHQRCAGRHMSGDQALAGVHPVFAQCLDGGKTILDFRTEVLATLLRMMIRISEDQYTMVVDYAALDAEKMHALARHFAVSVYPHGYQRMQQRMTFHSKEPQRHFHSDSLQKRQFFPQEEMAKIHLALFSSYERLLQAARKTSFPPFITSAR